MVWLARKVPPPYLPTKKSPNGKKKKRKEKKPSWKPVCHSSYTICSCSCSSCNTPMAKHILPPTKVHESALWCAKGNSAQMHICNVHTITLQLFVVHVCKVVVCEPVQECSKLHCSAVSVRNQHGGMTQGWVSLPPCNDFSPFWGSEDFPLGQELFHLCTKESCALGKCKHLSGFLWCFCTV